MPPLDYLLARFIRRQLPPPLVTFLLRHGLIIKPGLETSDPKAAVDRYEQILRRRGISLVGKRVLDFGYGGHFGVGVELLRRGAQHVVLCDPFAHPDHRRNRLLMQEYGEFLQFKGERVVPNPAYFTLIEQDVRQLSSSDLQPCDLVVSTSVYEHVDDPISVTRALARFTQSEGAQVHFVDLRDHFFKYPFEMLCYSETTWRRWLNPTSNLNRYRLWDYQRTFEACFREVELEVLQRDEAAWAQVQPRVRREFRSGDPAQDAVTLILIFARYPIK